jgi:arylsulfatase A-like enzyme
MKTTVSIQVACLCLAVSLPGRASAELRAGAAVVDITPEKLPVLVSGGFLSRSADTVKTPLKARSLVLDDGRETLAIVIVDTCMIPRHMIDEAKRLTAQRTGIRAERMLIAATHTHSAPSCAGGLGTDADPSYWPFLRGKLVDAVAAARDRLEPARVGWAVGNAAEFTALRRWVRRPDRVGKDPFGKTTVRANMHAARNWDDVTGETGPEDPDLSLISIQAKDGRPMAVLANFSMHYFSDKPISADYFGLFAKGLKARVAPNTDESRSPFVGMLCHGCSGDTWRRDYAKPPGERGEKHTIQSYTDALIEIAHAAYGTIAYRGDADLAMAETKLALKCRVPDRERLAWAREIVDAMGDRPPKDRVEVYAREQILLHERQTDEIIVQALRIGNIAIATTPTETYALTGLKLKLQSPLPNTMVLDLANGSHGYIPPPEQYVLGGYNTWPARSAGLEIQAEPKVIEAAMKLLEQVSQKPRRAYRQSRGPAARAIMAAKPAAYWRLDEFEGGDAADASGHDCTGLYEPGVVFFLPGPQPREFCAAGEENRAAHFAGGRMLAQTPELGAHYSVSLWFWNGMPDDARDIAGWLFSRSTRGLTAGGDHLGLDGAGSDAGKLVFLHVGDSTQGSKACVGRTKVERWTWNHLLFVRDGTSVRVYLNGNPRPEIDTGLPAGRTTDGTQFFFGGRSDNDSNWEGRLDEIAVFPRALRPSDFTPAGSAAKSKPPNIILLLCDNLGYGDVEPFGSTVNRTPHLNRMAREGMTFTHFCVTAGVCTPSRASIMTGCYAQRVGMHTNPRDGLVLRPISPYGLHPDEVTLAEVLKSRGYATAIIGKWHLGDQPEFLPTRQGFDTFFGVPYSDDMTQSMGQRLGKRHRGAEWPPLPLMEDETVLEAPVDRDLLTKRYTEKALEFIEENREKPFFLYLPHAMPGSTSEPFASPAFKGKSRNGPWGDSVEELDGSTGQILDKLVALGLDRQTLVIWTSDNGAPAARGSNGPLHGPGYTTAEGAFRVPTIMWWPGKIPAGAICGELTTTMDLLPTCARLAGAALPPDRAIDGHDIQPLMFGEADARSPYGAFYYYTQAQLQAVRSGPWKLFLPVANPIRHPHFKRGQKPAPLLFNVVEDTGSTTNVADKHPDVVEQLTALAETARTELGHGKRRGCGQRPPGKADNARPRVMAEES